MKIKRLRLPYSNYVQFTYRKQNGDVSERDVMVYHIDKVSFNIPNDPNSGIKDCLVLAFDVDCQAVRSFKLDGISGIVEAENDLGALGVSIIGINKYVWINNLYNALQMESVIEDESQGIAQAKSEIEFIKHIPVECIGFTGDIVLLLEYTIANNRFVDSDGVGKWVVMNNLTQGFITNTKDGKVRYMNVKELLELAK